MSRKYDRPRTIFLDLDGPIADFELAARAAGLEPVVAKMTPGFYRSLPVTSGAREAIDEMSRWTNVHLFIASKIPDKNPLAATEKALWVHEKFPVLEERIILTPNKACLGTARDFLVDDCKHKADAGFFPGTFLHFGSPGMDGWEQVMARLRGELVWPGVAIR